MNAFRLRLPLTVLGCLALVSGMSACGSTSASRSLPARQVAAARPNLFRDLLRAARDLGPAPSGRRVTFLLSLRDPSAKMRKAAVAAMYDPRTSHFGKFESPRQWASSGPSPAGMARARSFLRRRGVQTDWHTGQDWMSLSGSARAIEAVFLVQIHDYRFHGVAFYAANRGARVPAALSSVVASVGRITNYRDRHAAVVPANGLTPAGLRSAYDLAALRSRHLDGSGETVSFIEIDGYHQQDFDAFTSKFGLPALHPVLSAGPRLTNADGEAEMDLEVVHEIAPGARLRLYNCSQNCTNAELVSLENKAVRQNPRGILSISLGGCEAAESNGDLNGERSAFDQADALGESVFVASGDSGAYTCLVEDWGAPPSRRYLGVSSPASMPGVTGVGGTRLSVNSNGSWYAEEAWENPPATAGTGGGISGFFRQPSWQRGPGVAGVNNPHGMREVPDVAAIADPETSAQVYIDGQFTQEGGTSQAAPVWAGMTALIDQYLKGRGLHAVGFLNPALYRLAAGKPANPPFHDVTLGTNLAYPATRGYDMATGLGSPDAWNLARDLESYLRGNGS